jgi:S-DNA-T family DNA segregation ATPase FtsK/SpoIIIE
MRETKRTSKESRPPRPPDPDETFTSFLTRFERFSWDAAGVALLVFGILTLLALLGWGGRLLDVWARLLRRWLGWGSLIVILTPLYAAWRMFRRRSAVQAFDPLPLKFHWGRVLALEMAAFAFMAFLSIVNGMDIQRAEMGRDGGLIGWGIAELLSSWIPEFLAGLLCLTFMILGLVAFLGLGGWVKAQLDAFFGEKPSPLPLSVPPPETAVLETHPTQVAPSKRAAKIPAEFRKSFRVSEGEAYPTPHPDGLSGALSGTLSGAHPARPGKRDERLPPLNLLSEDERANRPSERQINQTAGLIEKTLAEFGIPARVVGFQVGPTVTQYAVEPGFVDKPTAEGEANRTKVRVAQIAGLAKDLALALAAERLRIEAPVPGRPYVGIEVPNSNATLVHLRPLLASERFQQMSSPLALALGRDVSGKPLTADLEKMPHMLIAGTTGSGKSVCIAALTVCLVMNNTPEDLRLVMIDPKMVELVRFNGLPHLLGKVETDVKRIVGVLSWTVAEMDRRYRLLEESHSRHIASYNRKVQNKKNAEVLPHIVLLIDELADLMMAVPDQTEYLLVRLAQLARATGIHLVVATQRPSTDVVTGLIKANFPARLSFAVASNIDSRVILDVPGAETLLGRGDMLFMPADAPAPVRAQGVMVTDGEIGRVIDFWKKSASADLNAPPPWEAALQKGGVDGGQDRLIEDAIAVIRQTQRANASLLQRRLRIGYPRAARLIDELEEMGLIGSPDSGGRGERRVLIEPEEDDPLREE